MDRERGGEGKAMTLDDQLVKDMRRELRLALRRLHNFPVNATVDADQLASVIGRVDGVFGGGVVDEPAPPLFAGEPELRKYVPSDGVMLQLLAFIEAIAEAATVFEALKAETMIGLDDVNRWLSLPAVAQARKAM